MVQCCVERNLLVVGAAFNLNFTQFFAPCGSGIFLYKVKIPGRDFGIEVQFCIFSTYAGDTNLS